MTSDSENDTKDLISFDFQSMHNKVEKLNYADGVAAGKECVFQKSFDHGYENGLRIAFELTKLNSFYETLKLESADSALYNEANKYKSLQIESSSLKLPAVDEADSLEQMTDLHKNYIHEFTKICDSTLPITLNLFK